LSMLAIAHHIQGDAAAAERASRDAVGTARSLRRPFDLAYALCFASKYESIRGNFLQAKRFAEEATGPCERHGFGVWLQAARLNYAVAIGHLGEVDRAIRILQTTLAEWRRIGCRYLATYSVGQLALFYAAAGRLEEALSTADSAVAQAFATDDLFYLSALHRIRADILAKLPDSAYGRVAAELRRAVLIARVQGAVTFETGATERLEQLQRTATARARRLTARRAGSSGTRTPRRPPAAPASW